VPPARMEDKRGMDDMRGTDDALGTGKMGAAMGR
jgi:hypothetical protein